MQSKQHQMHSSITFCLHNKKHVLGKLAASKGIWLKIILFIMHTAMFCMPCPVSILCINAMY